MLFRLVEPTPSILHLVKSNLINQAHVLISVVVSKDQISRRVQLIYVPNAKGFSVKDKITLVSSSTKTAYHVDISQTSMHILAYGTFTALLIKYTFIFFQVLLARDHSFLFLLQSSWEQ